MGRRCHVPAGKVSFSGNPHPVPPYTLQAVVLEPVVDTAVLNSFRNRMERFSLKARNNFAVGCVGWMLLLLKAAVQDGVTALEQTS